MKKKYRRTGPFVCDQNWCIQGYINGGTASKGRQWQKDNKHGYDIDHKKSESSFENLIQQRKETPKLLRIKR